MSGYVLTPIAKADIFHIWSYIAEGNEAAADRVEGAIFEAIARIAHSPLLGHIRPDLTTRPVRFWTLTRYPNFLIVYLPDTVPLQVVAVLHGKRNLRRILKQRR